MPDLAGFVIGMAAMAALIFTFRHADDFSDGNIGAETDDQQ